MEIETANPQTETVAPVRLEDPIAWDEQPEQLTTREVALLFGKSAANIRARASRGDFGNTVTGEDGLPRYDRSRVRALLERVTQREAQARSVTNLHGMAGSPYSTSLSPMVASALTEIQAQHREQVALWSARLEDAQRSAQRAQEETQSLRELLREREETTRATLTHMDMLHSESLTQLRQALSQEQAHKTEMVAAKDSEIARLRSPGSGVNSPRASLWQRLFHG